MTGEDRQAVMTLLDVDACVFDALRAAMAADERGYDAPLTDAYDRLADALLRLLDTGEKLHGHLPTAGQAGWLAPADRRRLERVTAALIGGSGGRDGREFLDWILGVYRQDVQRLAGSMRHRRHGGGMTLHRRRPRRRG
jgi:hypothetical protein